MGQKLSSKLFHISTKYWWILEIYISRGSVATQIRYGGIFSNHFITHFSRNLPVKIFENWSIFGQDMDKSLLLTFGATVYVRTQQMFTITCICYVIII